MDLIDQPDDGARFLVQFSDLIFYFLPVTHQEIGGFVKARNKHLSIRHHDREVH